MPKVSPLQGNFATGEISPKMYGRTDADRYRSSLATCLNYIPSAQGGLVRRPGTKFINEVKDSSKQVRLIPFQFSTTQAYMLEFGEEYIRFYKDYGIIEVTGTPYEVESPYQEADLSQINYTQSADILYLVHPDYPPMKLERFGDSDWALEELALFDGPYLSANTSDFTLTPSAATGSVTLTTGPAYTVLDVQNASGKIRVVTTVGMPWYTGDRVLIAGVLGVPADGEWTVTRETDHSFFLRGTTYSGSYVSGGTIVPALFAATDVGRTIRIKETNWGRGEIRVYTSGAQVTFRVDQTLTNTNAKSNWRLGAFSDTTGYPSAVVFHEDRLMFMGVPEQTIHGSQTGDYENFSPSDIDGTIASNYAVSFSLNSNDVNAIRWGVSDEKGLLIGTVGGEWWVRSASSSEALSPTSITAKRAASFGSAAISPVQAGKATLYLQNSKRKVRELNYFFDVDGFRSTDLTFLSEHISLGGIVALAFQKEPQPLLWGVREDGILTCMTYDRDVDNLRLGWSRHQIGGTSDASGTAAAVESVASIPAPDGSQDDLWVVVKRYIDGAVVRYVEVLTPLFDDDMEQSEAFFVDSGLTYDDPRSVVSITSANPAVVTVTAHGFSVGDRVRFDDVEGTTELNGNIYTLQSVTTNTMTLEDTDSTAMGAHIANTGLCRKLVSSISGLDHLEGEEVAILGDGATQPPQTVSSGSVTLETPAAVVHLGLGYNSDGRMLRLEAGAADGTALGKTRRVHRVGFLFHRSLNLLIGPDFDNLTRMIFRTSADPMGHAPELFSGIKSEEFESDYDFENQITWRQDQPLPSTILAVFPQMVTQDR